MKKVTDTPEIRVSLSQEPLQRHIFFLQQMVSCSSSHVHKKKNQGQETIGTHKKSPLKLSPAVYGCHQIKYQSQSRSLMN